jgi:hypothetical protein
MSIAAARPSQITTQEQLLIWAIMGGSEAFPTQFVQERPGLLSWYAEYQTVRSPASGLLFVGRVVIPLLEASELPSGAKPWLQAGLVPQGATIPGYFSSN